MMTKRQWTIKAISDEVVNQTRIVAKEQGMLIGGFVEMALRQACEGSQAATVSNSESTMFTANQVNSLLRAEKERLMKRLSAALEND